jgi:hypothetical protein
MFIDSAWLPDVDALPDGDIDIPFMEEDDPDMDMPGIDEDDLASDAAEPAEAGITATTDGTRTTAKTAPTRRGD